MLISLKLTTPMPIKTEPEEEAAAAVVEETKVPDFDQDEFDYCASCKAPFEGARVHLKETEAAGIDGAAPVENGETFIKPKRGQQGTIEMGINKKVKEFYSFNVVTGELLHVTSLQSLLSVFELRLAKSSPGLDLLNLNENLGFCQNCGTLISQLYKLRQEVAGLVQNGSVISKLIEYEDLLTDNQETDFVSPKKRKKAVRAPSKVNGISMMEQDVEMDHDGGPSSSWRNRSARDEEDSDPTWNTDDYDDHGGNDDISYENDQEEETTEDAGSISFPSKATGIKITSVGSARSSASDDFNYDSSTSDGGSRTKRRSTKKVDYKKVLDGPHIDGVDDDNDDEEWVEEKKKNSKVTARKKTGGAPPPPPPAQKRSRGRPSKSSASTKPKLVVPPPKPSSSRDPAFKSPADKSREATCQLCKKVFPAAYLAEHMNVSHNAVQGQPCLICGKFFENSYKAIKHLLTHVPEAAFGCSRCHDTFKTADERNQHTSSHLDSDKKLDCPKCTQSFTSLLLLNKHEAQKHRQTKSFLCSICAKLLTGKDEWIQHILSHGPFQCYYCKIFCSPGEYKRHVQQNHVGIRPKPGGTTSVIAEVTLD